MVQLVRIRVRAPRLGCLGTTQQLFLFLLALASALRGGTLAALPWLPALEPSDWFVPERAAPYEVAVSVPRLLLLATMLLLLLFWAEVLGRLKHLPATRLRPLALALALLLLTLHLTAWTLMLTLPALSYRLHLVAVETLVSASLSFLTALLFLLTGITLWILLRAFPPEAPGRTQKLWEVALVTAVCVSALGVRGSLLTASLVQHGLDSSLWVLVGYYASSELLPSALLLTILRKLPPPILTRPRPHPLPEEEGEDPPISSSIEETPPPDYGTLTVQKPPRPTPAPDALW